MEEIKVGLHNEWKIIVRDAKTGEVKKEAKSYNILLNAWWTRYLSNNNDTCLAYMHFGSGTDMPVATNTKLKTPEGSKSATSPVVDESKWKSDGFISVQKSCRLQANEYVGKFISEVGFAYTSTTTGGLVTHSIIRDMNGNAISIEKKADEVIDIYGTVFFKIGWRFGGGKRGYVEYVGAGGFVTKMLCNVTWTNDRSWNFLMWKSLISGKAYSGASAEYAISGGTVSLAYDTANKKITYSVPDADTSSANMAGGINGILIDSGLQVLIPDTGFTQPIIVKEVLGTGDGVTNDFQTSFGYVLDNGTFRLEVNDIEVSATADYNRGYPRNDITPYMIYDANSSDFPKNAIGLYGDVLFENPYHSTFGIDSMSGNRIDIYTSDDNSTWALAVSRTSSTNGSVSIPAGHQNKRYWKITPTVLGTSRMYGITSTTFGSSKNVHAEAAPTLGATVTATYQPDCIAKDSNHILKSLSVAISFAEYTPS